MSFLGRSQPSCALVGSENPFLTDPLREILCLEETHWRLCHLFPTYMSPQVLTIMFWTGSKVSQSLIHLYPGGIWLTVNLGNVIPDEVFAVFKGVIPHHWKDGPSFLIFLKLGYHPI